MMHFLIRFALNTYLYYPFYIVESVFETTNPYNYDRKNFNISIGNPMNTVPISLKTSGNVQLEILAKSSSFGQGNIFNINAQYFI